MHDLLGVHEHRIPEDELLFVVEGSSLNAQRSQIIFIKREADIIVECGKFELAITNAAIVFDIADILSGCQGVQDAFHPLFFIPRHLFRDIAEPLRRDE